MKKVLFLMLVMAAAFTSFQAQAQRAVQFPVVAGDTVSTSNSLDTVTKIIPATAGYSALGIQVVTTKVSGTVAGKAYLYGSIDGTNYVLTDSSSAFANQTTNTAVFTKTTTPYVYYKVMVRTQGVDESTQVNAVKVYYVLRKYN